MVGAGHAAYTDRFHELARLVPHLVTSESRKIERYIYDLAPQIRRMVAATKLKTIQEDVQIYGALTDEVVRNGSIKKIEKRGNIREPSKDKNGRDDNKRNRTRNSFAITINPVRRENTGTVPKCTTCNTYHLPGAPCRTCFNCNRPVHFAKDCREVPRNVDMNLVNTRNPTGKAYYECDSIDHIKPACPKLNQAQGPGGNHPNQALTINRGVEPSDLGFSYKIEMASGQLVEIDKVIKGCRLEIKGHVVKIPLLNGKVLRVLGEKPEEKMRPLMSAKDKKKEQEEIEVVRDFLEVFLDVLSGLLPVWETEFRLELIPGVTLVVKSPYCLAPSKLEELS
nr:hypothetical protein [Tanacetum cinerariifolium]